MHLSFSHWTLQRLPQLLVLLLMRILALMLELELELLVRWTTLLELESQLELLWTIVQPVWREPRHQCHKANHRHRKTSRKQASLMLRDNHPPVPHVVSRKVPRDVLAEGRGWGGGGGRGRSLRSAAEHRRIAAAMRR